MGVVEYVRREDMEQAVGRETERREDWQRRATDRTDRIELEQHRQREILVGKDGTNGLSSKVHILTRDFGILQRIVWLVGGSVITLLVGGAVTGAIILITSRVP